MTSFFFSSRMSFVNATTHPITVERKRAALETFDSLATNWPQNFLRTAPYNRKVVPKTDFRQE